MYVPKLAFWAMGGEEDPPSSPSEEDDASSPVVEASPFWPGDWADDAVEPPQAKAREASRAREQGVVGERTLSV